MRKASVFATACIALAAMVALSVPAATVAKRAPVKKAQSGTQPNNVITIERHDPACNPYGNSFGVFELGVSTPDNNQQWMVSAVSGTGIACGSSISCTYDTVQLKCLNTDYQGELTLNDHATITTPPGAVVTPATDLTDGAYAGTADINILSYLADNNQVPLFVAHEIATLTVDKSAGTDCPSNAFVCYKGRTTVGIAGHGWQWTTKEHGRNVLTIGPFYNDSTFTPAGLTKINTFALCGYEGDVGGNTCGDGPRHMYIQSNGDASAPDCTGGVGPKGVYSATATNKAGATTTNLATACVPWISVPDRFPPNFDEQGDLRIWPGDQNL